MGSLVYVPRLNASVKVCKGPLLWARGLCRRQREEVNGGRLAERDGGGDYCCTCALTDLISFLSKLYGCEWACDIVLHSVMCRHSVPQLLCVL